ncbi:MAG: response regulator [Betaproteobacteria bacterium]|nr:response regulator [Betaproteobacteria bacterium]
MTLNIEFCRCLIVEDDPFKMDSIRAHLKDFFSGHQEIVECHALSTALSILGTSDFDLAIIDMSIHSHEPEAGAGSPFPLSSGGLDVLFEIDNSKCNTSCIILTQYPDIEIEGMPIPVENAQKEIFEKFGIRVAGCVRYIEDDNRWKTEVTSILEKL